MCLLVLAWKHHPRYRLILAGNRDEFHDRPAAPLNWWQDDPRILGGRDLKAGGTWLGVARSGRFGVVTNYRDLQAPVEGAPSRGHLVPAIPDRRDLAEGISGRPARRRAALLGIQSAGRRHARAVLLFQSRPERADRTGAGRLRAEQSSARHAVAEARPHARALRKLLARTGNAGRRSVRDARAIANRRRHRRPALDRAAGGLGARRVLAVHRQRTLWHALLERVAGRAQRPHHTAGAPLRCGRRADRQRRASSSRAPKCRKSGSKRKIPTRRSSTDTSFDSSPE